MRILPLFITTAAIEIATGLALLISPAVVVALLLGTALDVPLGVVARITGAALITLGLACWLVRQAGWKRTTRAIMAAMLFYNGATAAVLAHAGWDLHFYGVALWPAVGVHVAMALWCVACLRKPADPVRLRALV